MSSVTRDDVSLSGETSATKYVPDAARRSGVADPDAVTPHHRDTQRRVAPLDRSGTRAPSRGAPTAPTYVASPAVRLRPMAVALAGAITPADVARAVVTHGVTALGAVAGCVAALDTAGLRFRVLASSGYSEALTEDWRRFRSDAHLPVVEAVRTRSPVLIESMIEGLARFPELSGLYSEAGNAAIAAVPLVAGGHAIGGAWVSCPGSGRFTEADRELLRIFAELAAGALHRAQSRAGLALGWSSTQ